MLLTSLDYGDAESTSLSPHRIPPAEDPCSNPLFFFFPHFYLLEKNIISLTRLVVSVPRLNYTEGALE